MSTTTPRLGLYKPADDGSELANVSTDLNGNLDRLEAAVGTVPVTSLPTSCFNGKIVSLNGRAFWADGAMPGGTWRELTNRPALSAQVTVASTAAETIMATLWIPTEQAVVGAMFRMTAFGIASVTGTPTLTLRTRLGGIGGSLQANSGARTASSGVSNHGWKVVTELSCISTGAGGTGFIQQLTHETLSLAGGPAWANPATILDGSLPGAWNTTTSQTMVFTATWSASSASNTCTLQGVTFEQL